MVFTRGLRSAIRDEPHRPKLKRSPRLREAPESEPTSTMDTEQQLQQSFLEASQEDFNQLETSILGLSSKGGEPQTLDRALRSAHSLKGSAGMMGFSALSTVAHQLEDYLKILRLRFETRAIAVEIETLLLQAIDCLRQINQRYLTHTTVDDAWLAELQEPIFAGLRDRLGELTEADEDALLARETQADVPAMMFASGVSETLEQFSTQIENLSSRQLKKQLAATASKLADLGRMRRIQEFVSLCNSIREQSETVPLFEIGALARLAYDTWNRSQTLIQLGRLDNLPDRLDLSELPTDAEEIDVPDLGNLDLSELGDISGSGELFADADELLSAAGTISDDALPDADELLVAAGAVPDDALPEADELFAIPEPEPESEAIANQPATTTTRVPVEQLQQISSLAGKLLQERNAIALRLAQVQEASRMMRKRIGRLETFDRQLRQWYDLLSTETANVPGSSRDSTSLDALREDFDRLELDNYSDIHLFAQAHMETLVQLLEAMSDIDLGLQEIGQASKELQFATRDLQKNVTRIQVRPFADVVGRLPRMVRDLCVQYGKQVELVVEGDRTPVDRVVLDALGNPLNHLVRNAFDHGIEPPEIRRAAGKPASGTITLRATNRGDRTAIVVADDGRGIDPSKIRQRLQNLGLSAPEVGQMRDLEILDAIFEPGFSTSDTVTELSGRGVGLDVVRANLEAIRGNVSVETQLGRGTTFTIDVPRSLSALRVAILESTNLVFAVALSAIAAMLRGAEIQTTPDGQLLWQEAIVPLTRLEDHLRYSRRADKPFEMEGRPALDRELVLIVGRPGAYRGLHAKRFWGRQEAILRPVQSPVPLPPGVTGSVLLADGRPIPLVEPLELVEWIERTARLAPVVAPSAPSPEAIGKTILVVDDAVNVRRYLALALGRAGYQVEQAKDGREAVEKLLGGLVVSAAICDIEMPRLDGFGVLEAIAGRSEFRTLPIVMLTSRSSDKHRQFAFNLGAAAYFSKPYNERELLDTLARLV